MHYSTWNTIESSPTLNWVFRMFHRLPNGVRAPVRWMLMPRWQAATALVRVCSQNTVVDGPFTGMKLSLSPVSSRNLLGYLLGTQELELRDVIEQVIQQGYRQIINIGAADGYYSVGLARRLPTSTILAYEALEELHPLLEDVAKRNGVEHRIHVFGLCQEKHLAQALSDSQVRTLVFVDIEGGEASLLDPTRVTGLVTADLLVETHDVFVPGCTAKLMERFEATHDITRIRSRSRTVNDFPSGFLPLLRSWMPKTAIELMNERRCGEQEWLYMRVKAR